MPASRKHCQAHCQARALSRPLRRTEYHIGPQRGDPGRAKPGQRALPHARSLFLAEGVHGGTVTRPEHDVPELVRVVEVVLAGDGHHGRLGSAGPGEQRGDGRRAGDLVPRVEGLVQRRLHRTDGFPEVAVRGLEQAGPPGGDRQHATGPDQPPHLRGERDRKSTRLNSSHVKNSYAVFCLKKKKKKKIISYYSKKKKKKKKTK